MRTLLLCGLVTLFGVGCVQSSDTATRPSNLTPGMAKKHIVPGKTTQTEILEIFGPPNLVTHHEGRETWTYDKISQEVETSGGFLTILIAGYERQRARRSSRSTMLILYFDARERVIDYALHASAF